MIKLLCTINIVSIFSTVIYKVSGDTEDLHSLNEISRGFGNQFDWLSLSDGLQIAKSDNKPLMLLIHKSWCGACKALKPQFASSKQLEKLSKHFVMVNVVDDEEPKDEIYSPDGGYIPRILFMDPAGKVLDKFYNEDGNPSYKYFYSDPSSIAASMKKVLKSFSKKEQLSDEL
ncbi:thioredoxin domain-containing protein 12-like [Bacillus rossius redtenbacheri]|uniref:thioredoxin domain-containing protein 12-like n=1 Tax=Bacillus rossius redtenbacheri TaxID=93214 RepID=UPI002FDC84E4